MGQGHPEEVYGCEFLGGGSGLRLASGSAESVFLWDVGTGCRLSEAGPPADVQSRTAGVCSYIPGLPFLACKTVAPPVPLASSFQLLTSTA